MYPGRFVLPVKAGVATPGNKLPVVWSLKTVPFTPSLYVTVYFVSVASSMLLWFLSSAQVAV